jgi:hypothetical protein
VCKLLWIEEVFVVTEVSDNIFNVPDEISEDLNVCAKLLFADVEIRLVLAG